MRWQKNTIFHQCNKAVYIYAIVLEANQTKQVNDTSPGADIDVYVRARLLTPSEI